MSNDVNQNNYPQFSEDRTESGVNRSGGVLDTFRGSPAIHHRPNGVQSVEVTDRGVILTLGTVARKSVLSYTHETSLDLYRPADTKIDELYLHIELWTDTVFRVIFSGSREIKDHFAGLPKDMRMLITEPENVSFAYSDNTIRTGKIEIHIDRETSRINSVLTHSIWVGESATLRIRRLRYYDPNARWRQKRLRRGGMRRLL